MTRLDMNGLEVIRLEMTKLDMIRLEVIGLEKFRLVLILWEMIEVDMIGLEMIVNHFKSYYIYKTDKKSFLRRCRRTQWFD